MATNPAGRNTKTIGINMHKDLAERFEKRAATMGLSTGAYIKVILKRWDKSKNKLVLTDGGGAPKKYTI
jgi:hypothetical protein